MILLRTRLSQFYHFVRPALSTLTSLPDLQSLMQQRLLTAVATANTHTLTPFSLSAHIQQHLALQPAQSKEIPQRSLHLTLTNPRTLESRDLELRLTEDWKHLKLDPEQFGLPFDSLDHELAHFSEQRGAPAFEQLNEYQLDDRTLLIFNLPDNVSEQDIQVILKQKAAKISFKYCLLGLPAYARAEFDSPEALGRCLDRLRGKKLSFGDRTPKLKSQQDAERLKLGNRRLAIHIDQDTRLDKLLVQLSSYGRVMHIDFPLEAYMNPTLEEIKQLKQPRELIRINKHNLDGTIESEYFPDLRVWKPEEDQREVENIVERMEHLKQSYENRARFARNVDIYTGREHELIVRNRGYCVVTYSTSEQCQNYYFGQGSRSKVQVVGNKMDFQLDPTFHKQLLRKIDNQYLQGKKNDFGRKLSQKQRKELGIEPPKSTYYHTFSQLNEGRSYESYYILQKIVLHRYKQQALAKTQGYTQFKELESGNDWLEWERHLQLMRNAKSDLKKQTFDELAEKELYGRVLPKDDKIQKIKFETTKYSNSEQYNLINEHNLMTNAREVKNRDRFYYRQRQRNNRLMNKTLGITIGEAETPAQLVQTVEEVAEVALQTDGDNIGKQAFSTARPTLLFRKRTAEEEAEYKLRYNQFVRSNIYEYMGIFHDKLLQESTYFQPQTLNPQALKFLDGSPFLTEQQLTDVLQFRRNLKQAQEDYENYIIGNEYIKSAGISLNTLHANFKQFQATALQHLVDVGIVEETRKVEGAEDQLRKKASILNTEVAGFGQQYRVETHNQEHYLVKVKKLEHLVPIDRVSHLEQVVQDIDCTITPEQAEIFEKHYASMKQTGVIPIEVRKAFDIEQDISVDQLMNQMGLLYNVAKKDLEIAERARTYSREQIKEDINRQYTIERQRKKRRKVSSADFVKDPSQIYVKDREGYYKVSRYRQI